MSDIPITPNTPITLNAPPKRWLLIACVVGVHGLRGDVKLKVFSDMPLGLSSYKQLYTANGVQAYTLRHVRAQGAGIVAGFAEITNRTQAEGLRGLELFIPREALADAALEPGAHFQADLIGLRVTTAQAVMVGVVVGMQNYGAGDLLEIQPQQGSTFLVPYQDVAILGIDLAQNELILDPAFLPD